MAGWWATRRPRDLSRLLNNKRLLRYSHGDSMKGAAQRQGEGGGVDGWVFGGSLGLDIACFVGGERLIISLSSMLQLQVLVAFLVFPPWPSLWTSLAFEPICFLSAQASFFSPWFLFVSSTHKSLSSFLFSFLWAPFTSSPVSYYYCNLSCLMSLWPATSTFTIFAFFCLSQLYVSLSSFSVSLAMLSTKKVISPLWL